MGNSKRFLQIIKAHLKAAEAYAELSYAKRLKVGAVLVKDGRIVSVGRNGMPPGGTNVCEEKRPRWDEESFHNREHGGYKGTELVTKPGVCHAELNAIAFAARNGVATDGCIMVVTDSPCFECSKLLVQAGIKEIYYKTEYRLTDSLEFLREYGVKVEKII